MRTMLTPKMSLAGLQWMFFILTNTIVVPLTLGHVFQLPPGQIAFSLQISFALTGAACMLQAYWGHRFALMDGPAGVWWGFTLSIAASAAASGADMKAVGGSLAAGYLLSGLMMVVLGLLGFARILRKLFNPVVISVSLFLLSAQLMANFFTGMLGIGEDGRMNPSIALLSVLIALFVAAVYLKGRGWVSNFAMLFGILLGWAAYAFTFPAPGGMPEQTAAVRELFPWGSLRFDTGIMAASFVVGFINMSNTVTSLKAAERLYGEAATESQYRRSFTITGLMTLLTPVFGLIPFGTFASSMGLLESMKILHRQALAIGGGLFLMLGLIPALGGWFAGLPVSVGSAVLFVAYLQMFGTAVRSVKGITFDSKTIYRLALPILLGISIMNTPSVVFSALPVYIRPLAGNGLVMGILMSLILETCVNWTKLDIAKEKGYD
ncbi:uracil/xanthine transporter [Paenibacillus sp. 1P03SA]|uniref:uracil/xanthine transporter n=1 Tax=Paenibacillus sp. 1P03SA TaxID=3132294 RepID=UPI00399FEE62